MVYVTESDVDYFIGVDQFKYSIYSVEEIWSWYYDKCNTPDADKFKNAYFKKYGIDLNALSTGVFSDIKKSSKYNFWGTICEDLLRLNSPEERLTYIKSKCTTIPKFYEGIIKDYLLLTHVNGRKFHDLYVQLIRCFEECYEIQFNPKKSAPKEKRDTIKEDAVSYVNKAIDNIDVLKCNCALRMERNSKLTYVKRNHAELYDDFLRSKEKQELDKESTAISLSTELIDKLQNGIVENGITREFDIIDYYLMTNINILELVNLLRGKIDNRSLSLIAIFVKKNSEDRLFSLTNVLKDKNVFMIDGVMHEVTEEEKRSTIEFLNNHNIAVNHTTYRCALIRMLNHTLGSDSKIKKLTK